MKQGGWTQNGVTVTNGARIFKLGDKIKYKSAKTTYVGDWRVLGVSDEGFLLILSEKPVEEMNLRGTDGYEKSIHLVDERCKKYGEGDGAVSARSIRVQDVVSLEKILKGMSEQISREEIYAKVFNTGDNNKYWLASPYIDKKTDFGSSGIYFMDKGEMKTFSFVNCYGYVRRHIPGNIKVVVEMI